MCQSKAKQASIAPAAVRSSPTMHAIRLISILDPPDLNQQNQTGQYWDLTMKVAQPNSLTPSSPIRLLPRNNLINSNFILFNPLTHCENN